MADNMMPKIIARFGLYIIIPLILLLALSSFGFWSTRRELTATKSDLASSTTFFKSTISDLENKLSELDEEKDDLAGNLRLEKEKNEQFENKIEDINDTVGTLQKWAETDPELLQKYSKVFFLNEHYTPSGLVKIATQYLYDKTKSLQIHAQVENDLLDMLEEASGDGVDLKIVSAFRSFGEQSGLKATYRITYGAGTANQFSADQGYSEHQLGTTVDFTSAEITAVFAGFEKTKAYTWLNNNAYKYGFVLSYPPNNTYYQFEPWHWRFVGEDLARDLKKDNKYFYDLDQRTIDTYLVKLFD